MEIGSEFEIDESLIADFINNKIELGQQNILLFSGRTCIDYIIKDIMKSNPNVKTVYLPEYCCQSMIDPFIKNGIKCLFYELNRDLTESRLENDKYFDILVIMGNYFGFNRDMYDYEVLNRLHNQGKIIIEDCTHSIFSTHRYELSDYRFASIRKWFPIISGAICSKQSSFDYCPALNLAEDSILGIKKDAMVKKSEYLNHNECINKKSFLDNFKYFNNYIQNNYAEYTIDNYSKSIINKTNIDEIKVRRRKNAQYLIDNIKDIDSSLLIFQKLENEDCPLFIPIKTKYRDELKKALCDDNIYCPTHWPHPNNDSTFDLYYYEISLVCDQRYSIKDMEKIIQCIKKWKCNTWIL